MKTNVFERKDSYSLNNALLLYKNGSGEGYVSIHEIKQDGNKAPVLGPGTPATRQALIALVKDLVPKVQQKTSLMPSHILSHGEDHLVWFTPPANRDVWFKCQELGERNANVPNPGLVFMVGPFGWYVFAVKSDTRPEPEEMAYQAPYFNVWSPGKICVGNVTTPKGEMTGNTAAWEEAFFRSYFTHPNIHETRGLVKHKEGAYAFWRDMLDGKHRKFPRAALVPLKETIGQLFSRLMAQGEGGYGHA
jgi:PRTRC genetic system protein B